MDTIDTLVLGWSRCSMMHDRVSRAHKIIGLSAISKAEIFKLLQPPDHVGGCSKM